jgi:hypothetical protein
MKKSSDIKMDSRESFKQTIFTHYKNISTDQIPFTLLDSLCDKITNFYYNQYTRFRIQYPKSIKRYSTFQLKDIDHPQTQKIVIDFFKNELKSKYRDYSKLLLGMTDKELDDLEKWWYDFERL